LCIRYRRGAALICIGVAALVEVAAPLGCAAPRARRSIVFVAIDMADIAVH
jgi:hypothetical protein